MPRVLVIGSANADFTVTVDRLPREGETVSGGRLHVGHGGKGANQAVAARRLGAEVRFLGCIGADPFGEEIAARLAAEGIAIDGLSRSQEAATGTALIVVDAEGRNQIAVAPGANRVLTADMLESREPDFEWAQVLLLQLETAIPTVTWALRTARRHKVLTILNPAPAQPLPQEIYPLVDYLTPNGGEASFLTGQAVDGPETARLAAEALLARGVGTVVVTLGATGALACGEASAAHFPAFPVRAVDTTGAGDAFNGGLAVGLAAGGSLEQAIPLANAAAALACTRTGAQDALPDRAQVEAFLRGLKQGV
ncbi:MAG: ribokinase [Candidatus Rokubacteria bacterium]|nr:ribokinase [Candidatus Rokubacteria bacterium]